MNNNCQPGSVCGRFNSQPEIFQCCSSYQEVDSVAWCANGEGSPCSDGENHNCMQPLACGVWAESTSGYACCSDYTTANNVATCVSSDASDNTWASGARLRRVSFR